LQHKLLLNNVDRSRLSSVHKMYSLVNY